MNWPLEKFTGKDIVFVGAGKGRAMSGIKQFLETNASIKSFIGVDKQNGSPDPLGFLKDYDLTRTIFIKNEAIPGKELVVPYITPLQLFFELVPITGAQVIGITGTKGKSTTSSLSAHILQKAGKHVVLAGNIGISPFQLLDEANTDTIFVLELSSHQLADLSVSPHISACINLYNDHADWHGSQAEYWEDKHNIMRFAGPNDVFIYNPQFTELKNWANTANCKTIAINPSEKLDLSHAKLFGDHNRLNALVAREITHQFNVSDDAFKEALDSFEPLKHRMQFVAKKDDRIYIDDAIGMTPESTSASLKAISEKYGQVGCLLLGGQDRNYDFTGLMQQIADAKIPNLVLFPDTVEKMKDAIPTGYAPQIFETTSMTEAVSFARKNTPRGKVVLLSTAAPSYSLWQDFEDKGNQFQSAVRAI